MKRLLGFWKFLFTAMFLAIFYALKVYAIAILTVLFVLVMMLFCLGAVWINLFPNWHPRGYFERRKERKLMEFTKNRERG